MDYDEAIEWLYGTQLFGIKLGLEGTKHLFDKLNLFDALEGCEVIHVAGTNGKGSTCAMIDSICRSAGKRSGLFTSPHLISFRERIRVNGAMIPENEAAKILTELRKEVNDWETPPTFFELAAALAVKYFCQQKVEVMVMETGMGGRLDATNVLQSSVSVITSVDLDHQEWLGEDLETIAQEKAGIMKSEVPVIVSSCQDKAVLRVFDHFAEKLKVSSSDWKSPQETKLKGQHQRLNAALAAKAVSTLWPDLSESTINRGLSEVSWPGRFDLISGNIVIDGAHNPAAIKALISTWTEEFGHGTLATIVFGAADSKEVSAILTALGAIAQRFIFVKLSAKRGLKVPALEAALIESEAREIPWSEASDVSDAIRQAKSTKLPVLVTGSLFLAGEVLALDSGTESSYELSEQ